MNRGIDRMDLPISLLKPLTDLGLKKCQDFYETSQLTLLSQTNLNLPDITEIERIISAKIAPKFTTALSLYYDQMNTTGRSVLPTGSQSINNLLQGGISVGCITELVGPPGIGKTQFCFSCSVETACSEKGVIFIDTELKFDPLRVANLLQSKYKQPTLMTMDDEIQDRVNASLELIQVKRPTTCRELMEAVECLEEQVLTHNVALVVIDSIAALARKENLNEDDKEEFIMRQSAILLKIAGLCRCCILVTNQVINVGGVESEIFKAYQDLIQDFNGELYRPALGPSWSHCVSTRLRLYRAAKSLDPVQSNKVGDATSTMRLCDESMVGSVLAGYQAKSVNRILSVVKSPSLPFSEVIYEITSQGIEVTAL